MPLIRFCRGPLRFALVGLIAFFLCAPLNPFTIPLTEAAQSPSVPELRTDALASALTQLQAEAGSRQNDPSYFYNLGTIHYHLGRPGSSVAFLEKAKSLDRRDPEILRNLEIARQALSGQIGEARMNPASGWLEISLTHLPIDELRAALGASLFVLCFLLLRKPRKDAGPLAGLKSPAGFLAVLTFGLSLAAALAQNSINQKHRAVALESRPVRSAPGEENLELGRMDEGATVWVTDSNASPIGSAPVRPPGAWRQIRFHGEKIGWVPEAALLLLWGG